MRRLCPARNTASSASPFSDELLATGAVAEVDAEAELPISLSRTDSNRDNFAFESRANSCHILSEERRVQ